jgi:hypothetical protein
VDLAAANYGGNNITVILNNGNGTFGTQTGYATGANTRALHGGDFDGDGDIDLCGSNNGASSVAVLLNNGDGTYQSADIYTVGSTPWGIQAGDYDGDGDLDIACNNYSSGNMTVLYNTGGGYVQEQHGHTITPYLAVYPNPASFRCTFRFAVPAGRGDISVNVFDVAGRRLRTYSIPGNTAMPNMIVWDGNDERGRSVASGVYFCKLESETISLTKELVLIR